MLRIEFAHQDHRAAQRQSGQQGHQRGVGIQGRGDQADGLRANAIDATAVTLRPAHAVRLNDALGHAGGAGGVNQVERPVAFGGDGCRRLGGLQPFEPGAPNVGTIERHTRHRKGGLRRHAGSSFQISEQHFGLGVVHHRRQMRGRGGGRQGGHDHACAQTTQKGDDVFHGRGRANRRHIAGLEAIALQCGGHLVTLLCDRGVVQHPVVQDQRGVRRVGWHIKHQANISLSFSL